MGIESLHITKDNPLILTTAEDLTRVVARILSDMGIVPQKLEREPDANKNKAKEMSTRIVRQVLREKGYKVNSGPALNAVLAAHNITGTRRGKENWYNAEQVRQVPER